MLDLELDDAQRALADSVAQFCRARWTETRTPEDAGALSEPLWRELAELGVFELSTAEGDGGALEVVAAQEALGAAVFPGPLAATSFAVGLLPATEAAAVARGEALVSLGSPPLWPFGASAGLFLEIAGAQVFRATLREPGRPVETLGGETWLRASSERGAELIAEPVAFALLDAAHAAYQAAAGRRLLDEAVEHARSRRQFGRSLGEFQAVSHPLADAAMGLDAAAGLARAAAWGIDASDPDAGYRAATARLSADRAALAAAFVAHQVFGAMGATRAGPAFYISRRIRQLASSPPGATSARARVLERFDLDARPNPYRRQEPDSG